MAPPYSRSDRSTPASSAAYGILVRLNRFRLTSGRYFVLVLDDGLISGPEYPARVYEEVCRFAVGVGCRAVMAYPGFFRLHIDPGMDVSRIISLSAATTLGDVGQKALIFTPEEAVRCGGDAVAVHLSLGVANEGLMLTTLSRTIEQAHGLGMVVLAAPYARDDAGQPRKDPKQQAHAARCAVELGANLIKVAWPGSQAGFEAIVDAARPAPVLLAGGSPSSDDDTVSLVRQAHAAGGAGMCIGRRILSSSNPADLMGRIMEILEST